MQNRLALEGLICSDLQKRVFSETFIVLAPRDSNQIVPIAAPINPKPVFCTGIPVL